MAFIAFIPGIPNSSINNFFFPRPTPCSPVTVPLTRRDSLEIGFASIEWKIGVLVELLCQSYTIFMNTFDFIRIFRIDNNEDMKITITNMTDNWSN